MVRSGFWRWIWSAAPAQPMSSRRNSAGTRRTTWDGDSGRMRIGRPGLSSTTPSDLAPFRHLERQQATQAVADDHRRATEGVQTAAMASSI